MTLPENAPSASELRIEAWEDANAPLPAWFRPPLHITRAVPSYPSRWPVRTVTCADHPMFHHTLGSDQALDAAEEHVRVEHSGQDPRPIPVDPWAVPGDYSQEPPF